jgi:sulfide:quinone oxidoreductase
MTSQAGSGTPLRVVVAGGGLTAMELLPALRALAAGRVAVTVLAPDPGDGLVALARQLGAQVVPDALAWVDPVNEIVHTEAADAVPYDALVVAVGARTVVHAAHAITVDAGVTDGVLDDLLRDVADGRARSAAFVVPERAAWAPALYDLVLDAAVGARESGVNLRLSVVTAENAPLAGLGPVAAEAVRDRLDAAGVAVVARAHALVPGPGQVVVPALRLTLEVDRVYALPELLGPALRGLPGGAHGFLPVDAYGRLRGVRDIYAAGDATDHPVKSGDVAARQADTVARTIAARAGADVVPIPFRDPVSRAPVPTRRGRLARIGSADVRVSAGRRSPAGVSTEYLTAFLRGRDRGDARPSSSSTPASPR